MSQGEAKTCGQRPPAEVNPVLFVEGPSAVRRLDQDKLLPHYRPRRLVCVPGRDGLFIVSQTPPLKGIQSLTEVGLCFS